MKNISRSCDENRFWKYVIKNEDGCWGWDGFKDAEGYSFSNLDGKHLRSHRASWIIHYGSIPEGMYVCHHCDNPECTRPDHLFLGTLKDNADDMLAKGRKYLMKGETNFFHKLTQAQVDEIRRDYAPYKVSCEVLSKRYGVTGNTVWRVVTGFCWKEVTGE
jgi:hypothetical protein